MNPTVADVMTRDVVTVDGLTPFKDIVRVMQQHRVSAVPVVDEDGVMLGIVSEGDLILKGDPTLARRSWFHGPGRANARAKASGLLAWQLMTSPVISVTSTDPLSTAARLMHRHTVKRLPVLDERRRIVGIVSRADLLRVFLRSDDEIEREIREEVVRRTLWIEPDTIGVVVRDGVVTLQGQVEQRSLLPVIERLVGSVEGVVSVVDRLSAPLEEPQPSYLVGPVGGAA